MLGRPRQRALDDDALRPTALRLLAQREHSRQELFNKLNQRGFAHEAILGVLDELRDAGWQSDARYAASYLRARLARGYGALAIAAELRHRGISQALIQATFEEESPDWHHGAAEQLRRHFGATPQHNDDRLRAYRHLINRGFRHEEARTALDTPLDKA